MEYHTTVDKISDQDPLCNTRKRTPHSAIIYKEKKTINHIYTYVDAKQFAVERKGKIKTPTRL